jgi:hypothetical protein
MYGDAMDIYIDNDGDGRMDDLDGNGRVDFADAEVLAAAADRVEKKYPTFVFAAFLWAAGDMALMFIESNHDLRATRSSAG